MRSLQAVAEYQSISELILPVITSLRNRSPQDSRLAAVDDLVDVVRDPDSYRNLADCSPCPRSKSTFKVHAIGAKWWVIYSEAASAFVSVDVCTERGPRYTPHLYE